MVTMYEPFTLTLSVTWTSMNYTVFFFPQESPPTRISNIVNVILIDTALSKLTQQTRHLPSSIQILIQINGNLLLIKNVMCPSPRNPQTDHPLGTCLTTYVTNDIACRQKQSHKVEKQRYKPCLYSHFH